MLTVPQQRRACPHAIVLFQRVILAKFPEQPTCYLSLLRFPIGPFRTGSVPLSSSLGEAGFWVHQRPDCGNDPDRNCITIDQVRYVISQNGACAYLLEPC